METSPVIVTKRKYNKSDKPRNPRKKKYHVEIKNVGADNFFLGEYSSHQEIANALNNLKCFNFIVSKQMIDQYFKSNKKLLSNVLITNVLGGSI